jgi:hypothetical protein
VACSKQFDLVVLICAEFFLSVYGARTARVDYQITSTVVCTTIMGVLFVLLMRAVHTYGRQHKQSSDICNVSEMATNERSKDGNDEVKLTKTLAVTMVSFFVFYLVPCIGMQCAGRFMS